MKPLTIEQLKALEVGEWVWLVRTINGVDFKEYRRVYEEVDEYSHSISLQGVEFMGAYQFDSYGKMWLAYKNKEQAESKGEIVELPCRLGDTVYFYDFSEKEIMQGKVIGIRLNYYTPNNPIWVRVQYDIPMVKSDCDTEVWASMVFINKSEAERRLAELTKEREIAKLAEIIDDRVGTNLGQIHGTKSGFGKSADITTTVDTKLVAQTIIKAGYGDTKQAVREFAAGLEEIRHSVRGLNVCFDDEWRYLLEDVLIKIDELLAEVTGNEIRNYKSKR